MHPKLFAITLSLLFFIGTASAATYYLDINGVGEDGILGTADDVVSSDSNPGTSPELPWKTLAKAQATATSGDTVIVADGNYGNYNESNINRTDWLTYRAATGNRPIFEKIKISNNLAVYDSFLVFDGFSIRPGDLGFGYKAGILIAKANHIRLNNLDVEGCEGRSLLIPYIESASWPAIEIEADSNDVVVQGSKIHTGKTNEIWPWGFSCGVRIAGAGNVEVKDNKIEGGYTGINITGNTAPVAIRNNDISWQINDGLGFGGGNNLTIENNNIHDLYIYKPALAENPLETTWNDDGNIMTNSNANWYADGRGKVTTVMQIEVISGTNCNIGDNEYNVSSVDPSGTRIILSKGIAKGGRPSDVNYFIKVGYHQDGMQANAWAYQSNVIIRGNKIYNMGHDKDQTCMWLNPEMSASVQPDKIGGHNFLVENNLCAGTYANEKEVLRNSLSLNWSSNSTIRNNTVAGQMAFYYTNTGLTLVNNIANYIDIRKDTNFANENYNIFNYGYTGSHALGTHTSRLFPAGSNNKWNDQAFTGIFADYTNGDFRLASANSLGVDHGDPANAPTTDILGNPRDSQPDAGAYEFQGTTQLQPCTEAQLLDYISQWKTGAINMLALMQKIAAWKAGTGCSG